MSFEEALQTVSVPAGADLSAKQYYFGKLNSSGQIISASAQGERCFGIIQNDPAASGRAASVAVSGITKAVAGATIAAGIAITCTAAGKVDVAATGDYVLGTAVTGGVANDIIAINLDNSYIFP